MLLGKLFLSGEKRGTEKTLSREKHFIAIDSLSFVVDVIASDMRGITTKVEPDSLYRAQRIIEQALRQDPEDPILHNMKQQLGRIADKNRTFVCDYPQYLRAKRMRLYRLRDWEERVEGK